MSHESKDTNPKDAIGSRKVPFSTVPGTVVLELGLALLEGSCKYGRHNYREVGVRASVYFDALMRHLEAWWDCGEDIDAASGLPHIIKAMACLAVLRDAQLAGKLYDDRPPPLESGQIERMNEMAAKIIDSFDTLMEPYTINGRGTK